MRLLFNIVVSFILVLGLVVLGYYFIKKPKYTERGEDFTLPMAARDLVRDITGSESSDPDEDGDLSDLLPADPTPAGSGPSVVQRPPLAAVTSDHWIRGMAAYAEGKFSEALPLLTQALDARHAPNGINADEEVQVVRLCCRLFDAYPSGDALGGPDIALITSPGGDTFLAEVVSESSDRITFRHKSMTFAIERRKLRDNQVARLDSAKLRLAREEYRRRLAELEKVSPRSAGDYLGLARFARSWGLGDKVGYCIRQGLTASGEAIEKELFQLWQTSSTAQAHAKEIRDLLRHFYPRGDFTRHAWQVSSRPPFAGGRPVDSSGGDNSPPSGIGGSAHRSPRTQDPKVNAMLQKADEFRRQGDQHYPNTLPQSKDAAEHRRKALAAYTKALELYVEAEEIHGVTSLAGTIKELMTRRYGLLKDTTLK